MKKPKTNYDPNEPMNRGLLDTAVETILEGVGELFAAHKKEMNARFDGVDNRIDKVYVRLRGVVKDEVKGIKSDLSNTPTREEFNNLEKKVGRFRPTS